MSAPRSIVRGLLRAEFLPAAAHPAAGPHRPDGLDGLDGLDGSGVCGRIGLRWDDADPVVVVAEFGHGQPRWELSRELLRAGCCAPAGLGDVSLFPHPWRDGAVELVLSTPNGRCGLRLDVVELRGFLARTDRAHARAVRAARAARRLDRITGRTRPGTQPAHRPVGPADRATGDQTDGRTDGLTDGALFTDRELYAHLAAWRGDQRGERPDGSGVSP